MININPWHITVNIISHTLLIKLPELALLGQIFTIIVFRAVLARKLFIIVAFVYNLYVIIIISYIQINLIA